MITGDLRSHKSYDQWLNDIVLGYIPRFDFECHNGIAIQKKTADRHKAANNNWKFAEKALIAKAIRMTIAKKKEHFWQDINGHCPLDKLKKSHRGVCCQSECK